MMSSGKEALGNTDFLYCHPFRRQESLWSPQLCSVWKHPLPRQSLLPRDCKPSTGTSPATPALNRREIIDFPFAVDAHIQNRESGRSWKGWAQISSTPYHKHFSWAQWNETQQRLNHLFPACPCQSYVHLFTLVFNVCFTQGKNSCFKVILRPLKEFKRFHEKVVFTLSRLVYPDTWQCFLFLIMYKNILQANRKHCS